MGTMRDVELYRPYLEYVPTYEDKEPVILTPNSTMAHSNQSPNLIQPKVDDKKDKQDTPKKMVKRRKSTKKLIKKEEKVDPGWSKRLTKEEMNRKLLPFSFEGGKLVANDKQIADMKGDKKCHIMLRRGLCENPI